MTLMVMVKNLQKKRERDREREGTTTLEPYAGFRKKRPMFQAYQEFKSQNIIGISIQKSLDIPKQQETMVFRMIRL